VGYRAGVDDVEKRKFLILRYSNSDPSVVQHETSHYTDCAIPAPRHEDVRGSAGIDLSFLTSAEYGGEPSVSR
jgi:hypothetical protein